MPQFASRIIKKQSRPAGSSDLFTVRKSRGANGLKKVEWPKTFSHITSRWWIGRGEC